MQLRLHNTLTRQKEVFAPIDPANVRMYVCGPTVYQRIHVGNARAFVVFDVLYRLLRHLYGPEHVTYVRNITDIDDKIIDQAGKDGVDIAALTERTTELFNQDLVALGCLSPTHQPRATQHIGGMVALIETLIARGHAYAADGHALFHVPSMPAYGRLSRRDREEQIAGARVEVAPYKRDPADFVLWKPSTPAQPGWESPWGRGRPGWHIECSAMSEAFLAPLPFDLHAGGLDLIFPHHENEIAQSCCAHGLERMANYWLHNGFLDMRGEKMSKSLGNVVRVPEALEVASGEAVRMHLLSTHYRQPADFSEHALMEAHNTLRRFYRVIVESNLPPDMVALPSDRMIAELADDLNTPAAIAHLHALATAANKAVSGEERSELALQLRADAGALGLLQDDAGEFLRRGSVQRLQEVDGEDVALPPALTDGDILALLDGRREARRAKDFARADAIRKELETAGIMLKDRPDGSTDWERR